jgi:hypothetical protein
MYYVTTSLVMYGLTSEYCINKMDQIDVLPLLDLCPCDVAKIRV